MAQLADFLLKYGPIGFTVILMLVCAFLYREIRVRDGKIYELFEKNEASAIRYAEGVEKLRQMVDGLIHAKEKS